MDGSSSVLLPVFSLCLYTLCEQHNNDSLILVYLGEYRSLINSDTFKIYLSNLAVMYILNLSF